MKLEQAHYEVSKDLLDKIFIKNLNSPQIKQSLEATLLGQLEDRAVIFPLFVKKHVYWAHNEGMVHCVTVGHTSSCRDTR